MANVSLMFTLKLRHLLPFTDTRPVFEKGSGDISALEKRFEP